MVCIQNVAFPKENVCNLEELFYRKLGFSTQKEIFRNQIVFQKNQQVTFNTYFNSLSIEKWIKYTFADKDFGIKINLKGKFVVSLIHMYLEDDEAKVETLSENIVDTENPKEFIFKYELNNKNGCLSFSLKAMEDNSIFYNASYVSDVTPTENNVKLGIGICTFKREQYLIENIKNIRNEILENNNSEIKDKLEIFISDNAQTLKEEDFNHKNVHLVKNKNTGGSGGFARCMIESIKFNKESDDKLTHLILMDDDIRFDTVSLERTYTILKYLKPEYKDSFVGGAMLRMDSQNIQYASGEKWYGERCENYLGTYNPNRDLTNVKDILKNEKIIEATYQAWWYCVIPMEIIREDNLPMPYFIKFDDIEYGVRNMKNLILLNGINVWHEPFDLKYSAQNEFYVARNNLASSAIHHAPITKEEYLEWFKRRIRFLICNYKYIETEHFCNGVNAFLEGVDGLKKCNLSEFHKTILPKGYKMVDVKDLPVEVTEERYIQDTSYYPIWSKLKRKFEKYTINSIILPSKSYAVVSVWGGTIEQTCRKKFLVNYEKASKKGFILKRSLNKALKCLALYNKTKRNIKNNFEKAYKDFETRWRELVTLEAWNKQYI